MNKFLNRYFSYILLISCAIGMFLPDPGELTPDFVLVLLGTIIFTSFFKIELTPAEIIGNTKKALIFLGLRFVVLPVLIFLILKPLSLYYSIVFLLLFLLPSAVASPTFCDIFKANINLSVTILVISSFFSILFIPFFCSLFIHESIPIDRWKMFKTLFFTIILPFILHLPFRKIKPFRKWIMSSNTLIAIICLAGMLLAIFAKYKLQILNSGKALPEYILISFAGYFALYAIGWFLLFNSKKEDRITYSVSSGANNIGLGVAITILYFPANIVLFFIIADIAWVALLIPVKLWYRR